MEKEIRNMNVKELKALAKERGIKRYYWLSSRIEELFPDFSISPKNQR